MPLPTDMRFQVYDLEWSTSVPLEGYDNMAQVKDALKHNPIDHGRVMDTVNNRNWMIKEGVVQVRPSVRKKRKKRSKGRDRSSNGGSIFASLAAEATR